MRNILALAALFTAALLLVPHDSAGEVTPAVHPLRISADGRSILDAAGSEVFFSAEAAWHLIQRLTREEALSYLDDREEKGFNALLVMLMVADGYHGTVANAYGDEPFLVRGDFSTPNESYFSHADWVLERARERGMTVFLAPTYLGFECGNQGWCQEMKQTGATGMRNWGRWVGNRYRNQPNIVWVQGGDADAAAHGAATVVDAVAEGIQEVDPNHLHTAHCNRYNSAADCYDRPWLDINTTYADCQQIASSLRDDYDRSPRRPFVFIEGRYEEESDWTPECMRAQAYLSLLGGASGHFFGHGDIWGFFNGWLSSLQSSGSVAMARFDDLLRSRSWDQFIPDYGHYVLLNGYGDITGSSYAPAARSLDGDTVLVYLPTQRTVTLQFEAVAGETAEVWWFDPSDGDAIFEGTFPTSGTRSFSSPSAEDWVLLVDNAAAGFTNIWEEPTSVEPELATAISLQLSIPSPNPFNPRTSVFFEAPAGSHVRIEAFDARGRSSAMLFDGRASGSRQEVVWDASNQSSGVYFIRMEGGGEALTRKAVLVQ